MPRRDKDLVTILSDCREQSWHDAWLVSDTLVLIVGVLSNAVVLWLLLRERKSLSASQVLGVNLVVMDLIFLCIVPVSLTFDIMKTVINSTEPVPVDASSPKLPIDVAKHFFGMFNLVGCPLLLACMCIERYMAVIKPVMYLRMKNGELRTAVSAVVWVLTLFFCVGAGVAKNLTIVLVPVSILISWLFIIMLACLGGVVWSLWQQSPAHAMHRKQAHSESPLKRRALGNVLAVVVPAVVSYFPVLVMSPLVLYIFFNGNTVDVTMCSVIELSMFFPRLGVLVGPLFYLSKAKQLCCQSGAGNK